MESLRRFVLAFRASRNSLVAVIFAVAANQLAFVAVAAAPAGAPSSHQAGGPAACSVGWAGLSQCDGEAIPDPAVQLNLPHGSIHCPSSGPGAACSGTDSSVGAAPGLASVPEGESACPNSAASPVPSTPAACTNILLRSDSAGNTRGHGAASRAEVLPSVPVASLEPVARVQRLALDVDLSTLRSDHSAVLTATATRPVTGTYAIEIFDQTTGTLAGACTNASQCLVAYSARGGVHTFAAYITSPTTTPPAEPGTLDSNRVKVAWLDSAIAANNTVVGPGHAVTFTASSTIDVTGTGRRLVIFDQTTHAPLTYCSRGTTCTASVTQSTGGVHKIVGWVTGQPEAVSAPISVTWLTISLAASTTAPGGGGTLYLRATTNTELTTTPWVIAIYDERGRLVDHACKTGRSCSVQAWVTGPTLSYTAVIGILPPPAQSTPFTKLFSNLTPTGLVDVQARSASVQPTRLLWGVDSCKAFTQDAAGTTGLLPRVTAAYGTPDFWGRYLTKTACPAISPAETSAAAAHHMGILPIYNDYDCSAVSSYATGLSYATAAVAAAEGLGIPLGRVLAIDIEPPGAACPGAANVDSGFIEGWYDGILSGGYAPAFYGNGTNGSEFGSAWCAAVAALPNIARDSYLWSFEPSLSGTFVRAGAPNYAPYNTGCAGISAAWQYQLSSGSGPDVDTDLAMSQLPLWYPQP